VTGMEMIAINTDKATIDRAVRKNEAGTFYEN
jgi:hypothetical protein